MTAFFQDLRDIPTFSSNQAVKLLESYLGYIGKLNNVTIKPLPSNVWFLTGFVYDPCDTTNLPTSQTTTQLNGTRYDVEQPALSLLGLLLTGADVVAPQDDDLSSGDNLSDSDLSDDDEYSLNYSA